ncbi:MAG: MgtC/SapB family protein [Bacteroidales bacterium]
MEHNFINFNWEWSLLIQLFLATVLGALVGLEREVHGRPAGLRTHILVCLGSALIIVAFEQLQANLTQRGADLLTMDPARAAAGVITGIGFLGAGTILKGKDHIMGLTTAASVWVVAAIGITIGLGQFFLSITATLLVLFALFVLHKVDIKSEHYGEIFVTGTGGISFYKKSRRHIDGLGFQIKGYTIEAINDEGIIKVRFMVKYKQARIGAKLIEELFRLEGVKAVSWDQ